MNLRDQLLKEYDDMRIWDELRNEIENKKARGHEELLNKVQEVIGL